MERYITCNNNFINHMAPKGTMINFEDDPIFKDALKPGMSRTYYAHAKKSMELYLIFYKQKKGLELSPGDLLNRKDADRGRPHQERGQVEREFLEWVTWLKTTYEKPRGGVGLGASAIKSYASCIKSFYSSHSEELSNRAALPRSITRDGGKLENVKVEYRPKTVRKLLSVMRNSKDKAVTMLMFQGGADLKTIFNLRYQDVMHILKSPGAAVIRVKRDKVSKPYKMCIGRNALEYLNNHIEELKIPRWTCPRCSYSWRAQRRTCSRCRQRDKISVQVHEVPGGLEDHNFLFMASEDGLKAATQPFQERFRQYVILAGIVPSDQLKRADKNPGGPYALRMAFRSIVELNGMQESLAESLMGHVDRYGGAYRGMTDEELLARYCEFEKHLSITDITELGDVQREFEKKIEEQNFVIAGMDSKNREITQRLEELERAQINRAQAIRDRSPSDVDTEAVAAALEFLESDPRHLEVWEKEKEKGKKRRKR